MEKAKKISNSPKAAVGADGVIERDRLLNIDNHYALKQQFKATEHDLGARQWLVANMGIWKQ